MTATAQALQIEDLAGRRCHLGFEIEAHAANLLPDSKTLVATAIVDLVSAKVIVEIAEVALSCSGLLGSVRMPTHLTQRWPQ